MDPVSIIVMALATGAGAALKPTAEDAVKGAYAGIKALIGSRYGRVEEVDSLEKDPASQNRQGVLKEELQKAEVGKDEELLRRAQELLDAVQTRDPDVATAVGFSVPELKAASLRLKHISAHGPGAAAVKGDNWEIGGAVDIEDVHAESGGSDPKV